MLGPTLADTAAFRMLPARLIRGYYCRRKWQTLGKLPGEKGTFPRSGPAPLSKGERGVAGPPASMLRWPSPFSMSRSIGLAPSQGLPHAPFSATPLKACAHTFDC